MGLWPHMTFAPSEFHPMGPWPHDNLATWEIDPMVLRRLWSLAPWVFCPTGPWALGPCGFGTMELWDHGTGDHETWGPQDFGTKRLWSHGTLAQCIYNSFLLGILLFFDLGAHAKFRNPITTLSGVLGTVWRKKKKEEEKLGQSCAKLWLS